MKIIIYAAKEEKEIPLGNYPAVPIPRTGEEVAVRNTEGFIVTYRIDKVIYNHALKAVFLLGVNA